MFVFIFFKTQIFMFDQNATYVTTNNTLFLHFKEILPVKKLIYQVNSLQKVASPMMASHQLFLEEGRKVGRVE